MATGPDPDRAERVRREIDRYLATERMTDDERAAHFGLPRGCRMRERAKILSQENLTLGEHVWIGEGAMLDATGGLAIGSHTSIGLNVMIWTHSTVLTALAMSNEINSPYRTTAPVSIGSGCFIGGPSVIMPGVTIGERVVVLPMSLISKDVRDRVIVGGAGRIVRELTDEYVRAMFEEAGMVPPHEFG